MILTKGLTRIGFAVAAAAMMLGTLGLISGTSAHAQNPPATYYGGGLASGDSVAALVGGVECGTATADANGEWVISVGDDAACSPSDGDTVTFTLNGDAANESETWAVGGLPTDVASGVSLTAAAGTTPPVVTPPVVTPPDTGNAGLSAVAGGSSSPLLALGLGVVALAMLAGARTATGRSR